LVSQYAHDAVCELSEAHESENMNNPGGEKEQADVASEDNTIKTGVFEVDIFGKLLHKGVLHGQGPFWSTL
jgi:hypothetical protein